jgi:hypothetical protein
MDYDPIEAQRAKSSSKIKRQYEDLRISIAKTLEHYGITDYELFGAGGKHGESLSPLEYQGSLRVVGPSDPEQTEQFIDVVHALATGRGFKIDVTRPPTVTHAFGKTFRRRDGESGEIANRPFVYIYKSYRREFPTEYEREMARQAGLSSAEQAKLMGTVQVYEDIASKVTSDPHFYEDEYSREFARRIGRTYEFKMIREEIMDASKHGHNIQRSICAPLGGVMAYFLAESRDGNTYVDLIGCPPNISDRVINKLSTMMAS